MMTKRAPIAHVSGPREFAEAFAVSRETIDRLALYDALLKHWQKAVNLVAPSTLTDTWHRHFADSAQLLALAPEGARRWLDLGSGGGFPGLVLAIMLAETGPARVTLVESDLRKAAFLREVVRQTGLRSIVEIIEARIENAATHSKVGQVEVITARALAPLQELLDLAAPYFAPATVGLFLEGRRAGADIERASGKWSFLYDLVPSLTDSEARVAMIRQLGAKTER